MAWHELASVCGASHGRIAWASGDEFWTVSDGVAGQAASAQGVLPPLEDDTLCRFAPGAKGQLEVARSYASPAFLASSYQAMTAAACLTPSDCWFGGEPLPAPQPGAFNLHWNGAALEAQPNATARSVLDIRAYEGRLLEASALALEEAHGVDEEPQEILHPFVLYGISSTPAGAEFHGVRPLAPGRVALPEYAAGSYPAALGAFQLSATPEAGGGESLWAAAGPVPVPPKGSQSGALTILHEAGGVWSQVLGPAVPATLASDPPAIEEDVVRSIAAEPGSSSAWLALDTQLGASGSSPTALATVAHVQADGALSEEQLPTADERAAGVPPQGAAAELACPAQNDCWLATTRGALFHLSEEGMQTLPVDGDQAFAGPPITYRPQSEGLPLEQFAIPGNAEEGEALGSSSIGRRYRAPSSENYRVQALPYTGARSRLLPGHVLQITFRLAVRSRVRLVAVRHAGTVARTSVRTLAAGSRRLLLKLDPRRWPTRLELQVHPLAPLPTSPASRSVNTITTTAAPLP